MFKRILVPMDGSERAELTGRWTARLAGTLGGSLTLLAVVEPDELELPDRLAEGERSHPHPGPSQTGAWGGSILDGGFGPTSAPIGHGGSPTLAPALGTQVVDRAVDLATRYLKTQARRLRDRHTTVQGALPVNIDVKVSVGSAAEEIVKAAGDISSDIIAMPRHRNLGTAIGLLGSTTDRVLRTSPVPVLVTDPKVLAAETAEAAVPACPEVVIVPLDRSRLSETAVEPAMELAKACGAELRFVHVVRDVATMATAWAPPYLFSLDAELREAGTYLERFAGQARDRGLTTRPVPLVGTPGLRIVEEAAVARRALVVMTTHGRTGYRRLLLGSVTDKVVRSAECPVLVLAGKGA